jgi:acyl-CoA thioesterase-1
MIPVAALLFLVQGCAGGKAAGEADRSTSDSAAGSPGPVTDGPVVLFVGTSLTAGYGLDGPELAYPALIQQRLDSLRSGWRAVNAGVSGETSAGALRRLAWLLQGPVRVLVVETGANDGLRGQTLDSTRANLEAMVRRARAYDSTMTIVLAGMEVPPNLGPRYADRFRAMFRELAERERLVLIPFLLEGVGGVDSLNQPDGIHPNEQGQAAVARNVWRVLGPLVAGETP